MNHLSVFEDYLESCCFLFFFLFFSKSFSDSKLKNNNSKIYYSNKKKTFKQVPFNIKAKLTFWGLRFTRVSI